MTLRPEPREKNKVRSHARALHCAAVVGYSEHSTIFNDVVVLSASGTAVTIRNLVAPDAAQLKTLESFAALMAEKPLLWFIEARAGSSSRGFVRSRATRIGALDAAAVRWARRVRRAGRVRGSSCGGS